MDTIWFSSSGPSGNIYCILGMVRKSLREAGKDKEWDECMGRVRDCNSYNEALAIIREYVDLKDTDGEK